jgi:hypothetical protein
MLRDLDSMINWEVEKKDIFTDGEKIDGYQAIRRNDNNKVLSVMKTSYSPMLVTEFLETVEKIKEISGFELVGFNEFREGRKILGFLKNNRENFYIGNHKIDDYMLLGNSFDGTSSFFQGTSTVLIRCTNQFSQIHQHNKVRHTKNFKEKMDEFYSYLNFYFNERAKLYSTFEKLGNIKFTEEMREKMIKFVLNVPEISDKELSKRKENQMSILRDSILTETKELGENLWGAFNGITHFTTHKIDSRNPVFGNVFGSVADINTRGMEYVSRNLLIPA